VLAIPVSGSGRGRYARVYGMQRGPQYGIRQGIPGVRQLSAVAPVSKPRSGGVRLSAHEIRESLLVGWADPVGASWPIMRRPSGPDEPGSPLLAISGRPKSDFGFP
jgi:hypothetical protein